MIDKTSNQAAADPSIGVLIAAVEARTGRSMTPEEVACLLDNMWWLRRTARTVHDCVETTRRIKKRLVKLRADKDVLERAEKIVKYTVIESESKKSALTVLKDQLNMFDRAIAAGEGGLLRDLFGESFEGGGTRRKQALETLVLIGLTYWFDATGDDEFTIQIGHPDRPGPFLRFLEAISEGVPGGITRNSLYDKTRQVFGRRG